MEGYYEYLGKNIQTKITAVSCNGQNIIGEGIDEGIYHIKGEKQKNNFIYFEKIYANNTNTKIEYYGIANKNDKKIRGIWNMKDICNGTFELECTSDVTKNFFNF